MAGSPWHPKLNKTGIAARQGRAAMNQGYALMWMMQPDAGTPSFGARERTGNSAKNLYGVTN